MEFADLKNKSDAELKDLLNDERSELHALNLKAHNRTLKQVHKVSATKMTIAQILTILNSRKTTAKQ